MAVDPILPREALAQKLDALRAERPGLRVVLCNGVFDLLHAGHVGALEEAARHGDLLVVALNDDDSARALKGEGRPFVPLQERAALLRALSCVDGLTSFGERDLAETLRLLRPTHHAKGRDYDARTIPAAERAVAEELGIELILVGPVKRDSSTRLARRVAAWAARQEPEGGAR